MAKMKRKLDKFKLADKLSEPSESLMDYSIWIYGKPGQGKTTLANQFGKVHHGMCEDGAKAYRFYKKQLKTWRDVTGYIKACEEDDVFDMFTLDPVESAYDMCFKEVCRRLGIDYPDEAGYGKGWKAIRDEFMSWTMRLMKLPQAGSMFISHASSGERTGWDGEKHEDIHPSLTGKILDVFTGVMDLVGYYHTRKGQAVLQIRGDDSVFAKCRVHEHFRYTDGTPIKFIPMGESHEEAYQNLMAAFNNEMERPEAPSKKKKIRLGRK